MLISYSNICANTHKRLQKLIRSAAALLSFGNSEKNCFGREALLLCSSGIFPVRYFMHACFSVSIHSLVASVCILLQMKHFYTFPRLPFYNSLHASIKRVLEYSIKTLIIHSQAMKTRIILSDHFINIILDSPPINTFVHQGMWICIFSLS